jgi:class 3 adenylate cyclase
MLRQAVAGSPPQSTDYQLLQKVRHERFPKARYDPVPLIRAYGEFVEESIRPLILSKYLEECVRIWPPLREAELLGAAQSVLLEEARYVGEHIVPRDLFFPLSVAPAAQEPARDEEAVAALLVRNFSRLVTVMVYDIRGSTFMGNKLRDAEKEKSIRNAYNRRMLEVGRKYGAFLLKDTGDGGILWFGGNSGHLQETLFSSPSGFENAPRQALPLADDLGPVSSSDSALRAVRCAAEMVHAAEEFVRENLGLYSDWFKAREEKQLFYAGIPFADLPPEYRRIFQIGVGLASGNPRQDLSFGQNAFGDYDVTGTLVREAHFYSLGRHPDRSVIICDGATLLNLLLNCERFALEEARSVSLERQLSPVSMRSVLRQQAEAAFREQQSPGARRYRFSDYGLIIQRIGKRTLAQTESPGTARTIVTDQSGDRFEIDEEAILRDEAKGVVRAVYEIRHLA